MTSDLAITFRGKEIAHIQYNPQNHRAITDAEVTTKHILG